jgi:hypothetical protein
VLGIVLLASMPAFATPPTAPASRIAISAALPSPRTIVPSRWRRLQDNVARLRQSGVPVMFVQVPLEHGPETRMVSGTKLRAAYISYTNDATLAHELQHLSDKTRGVQRTLLQREVAANFAATGDVTKAVDLTALNHPELNAAIDGLRSKNLAGRALFRIIIRGKNP